MYYFTEKTQFHVINNIKKVSSNRFNAMILRFEDEDNKGGENYRS